ETRAGEEHGNCPRRAAGFSQRENCFPALGREGAYSGAVAEMPPGGCRELDGVFLGTVQARVSGKHEGQGGEESSRQHPRVAVLQSFDSGGSEMDASHNAFETCAGRTTQAVTSPRGSPESRTCAGGTRHTAIYW
ncbi:unnamed protein product, partial [Sphacelaria rigidula]